MKVLSIGTDRKLFEKDSAVAKRNISYGEKMEELHIIVFSLKSSGFTQIDLSPNVKVYPTNSFSKFGYIFDAIRLGKKIIKGSEFIRGKDVLTAQDPFECGFVAWRISRVFRLPFQLQIHTDFLSPYFKTSLLQKIRVILAKFLLPKASGVRVVSKRISDSIKKAGIKTKVTPDILPIRIDTDITEDDSVGLTEESDLRKIFPNFKFIILMASRLTKEKRIGDAITAFAKVLEKYPFVSLCIVGDGPLKNSLNKKVSDLGISKNVAFLGWRNDVSLLMKSANMFLSTSEYEGYGMSIVEAGMSKCPVLSTNVGISEEILEHNKNSYICSVGDTMCLSEGIVKMIENNSFRLEMSEKLYSDLKDLAVSKEEYVDRYVNSLQQISK